MLCFSEHQPGELGPRRVTQAEIRASFAPGWRVESIEASEIQLFGGGAAQAWLAEIVRTGLAPHRVTAEKPGQPRRQHLGVLHRQ